MLPGTTVQYRLLGSSTWLKGQVRATRGSAHNGVDQTLAAQLQRLNDLTRDTPVVQSVTVGADGRGRLSVPMKTYDVVLVETDPARP